MPLKCRAPPQILRFFLQITFFQNETVEVDHRNFVENGLPKRQTSHKTLSYKTSSGGDGGSTSGSIRRNSLSSQESSQTSQESIPYSASPPKYDSHSAKAMQAAALQQYAQRNRKGMYFKQ